MLDDIEIELENDQPSAGSEAQTTETPADTSEKQDQALDESIGTDTSEEKSKEDVVEPKEEAPEEPKMDEDLDSWAEKAGHEKPETDKERKLLQKLRDSQREFTKDRQIKKGVDQLRDILKTEESAVDVKKEEPSDLMERRLAAIENDRQIERSARLQSEFFVVNSIDEDTGKLMGEIITEKVARASTPEAKQRVIDHWGNPDQLQDLYDIAKARQTNSVGKEGIVDEATRKERERLETLSRNGGVNRNAKSTVPANKVSDLDKLWTED